MKYSETTSIFSQAQTDFIYYIVHSTVTKRNKRIGRVIFNHTKKVKKKKFFNKVNSVITNLELLFKRKQLSQVERIFSISRIKYVENIHWTRKAI